MTEPLASSKGADMNSVPIRPGHNPEMRFEGYEPVVALSATSPEIEHGRPLSSEADSGLPLQGSSRALPLQLQI